MEGLKLELSINQGGQFPLQLIYLFIFFCSQWPKFFLRIFNGKNTLFSKSAQKWSSFRKNYFIFSTFFNPSLTLQIVNEVFWCSFQVPTKFTIQLSEYTHRYGLVTQFRLARFCRYLKTAPKHLIYDLQWSVNLHNEIKIFPHMCILSLIQTLP